MDMAYTDAHRTTQERDKREAQLAAMRRKWQRNPPRSRGHTITRQRVTTETVKVKPKLFTPGELAHAIRIAAKDAKQRPNHNPVFVEALEIAASMFEELERPAAEQEPEVPMEIWRQVDPKTFAIQSEQLQMTDEGLRIAMYQIPKALRKGLLRWRWKRRYRDANGKQWLEFYSPESES